MSKIALTLSIVEELSSEIDDFFLSNFELLIVLDNPCFLTKLEFMRSSIDILSLSFLKTQL